MSENEMNGNIKKMITKYYCEQQQQQQQQGTIATKTNITFNSSLDGMHVYVVHLLMLHVNMRLMHYAVQSNLGKTFICYYCLYLRECVRVCESVFLCFAYELLLKT